MKKVFKIIIIGLVLIVLALLVNKCLKGKEIVEKVEAAEISGIVAVGSQKLEGSDVMNVDNNLIRLSISQAIVDDKAEALIKADLSDDLIVVREAWVKLDASKDIGIKAGKILIPGSYSSQVAIEDQKLITAPQYKNTYDNGVNVLGKLNKVNYSLAAINGDTINNSYDLAGRVSGELVKGIEVGASCYDGRAGVSNDKFNTLGVDAKTTLIENLELVVEFNQAKNVSKIKSTDFYIQGSVAFGTIEPVLRVEKIDFDTEMIDDELTLITAGVNINIKNVVILLEHQLSKETGVNVNNDITSAQILLRF